MFHKKTEFGIPLFLFLEISLEFFQYKYMKEIFKKIIQVSRKIFYYMLRLNY